MNSRLGVANLGELNLGSVEAALGAWVYTGTTAITFGGTATTQPTYTHPYTGVTAIDFGIAAVTFPVLSHPYTGTTAIDFGGAAVTLYTPAGAVEFSYTGTTAITFGGAAVTQPTYTHPYVGVTAIDFGIAAVTQPTHTHPYVGTTAIVFDAAATVYFGQVFHVAATFPEPAASLIFRIAHAGKMAADLVAPILTDNAVVSHRGKAAATLPTITGTPLTFVGHAASITGVLLDIHGELTVMRGAWRPLQMSVQRADSEPGYYLRLEAWARRKTQRNPWRTVRKN